MSNYVLENEKIRAEFRSKSAELISLKRKKDGREYMWSADPAFWGWSSPLLFPVIGAFHNDSYTYNGKEYHMIKHGFARHTEFKLEFYTKDELWMSIEDTEETWKDYPFHFKLEAGYRLKDNCLEVMWKVTNKDDSTMYFNIGGHPAFSVDLPKTDRYLGFEGENKEYKYMMIDLEKNLVSPKTYDFQLEDGMHQVTKGMLDFDALIFGDSQVKTAFLAGPDKKPYIKMHTETPLTAFWSINENAPYICFEPWFGTGDRTDFSGSLDKRPGEVELKGKDIFRNTYTIEVVME